MKLININKNISLDKILLTATAFILLLIVIIKLLLGQNIEITAHRGYSSKYPENSLIAFKEAIKLDADWLELDVQQTKDQKLIIMHDYNFLRTTGIDKNVWEVTYDEIKDYDIGSFFNPDFQNERVPLLEDVIKLAKENNVKLNIELKPTGHEINFEKSVINMLHKYNYTNKSVIASFSYDVIKNVKKFDKKINTIFISFNLEQDISYYKDADSFSLFTPIINANLVTEIHKNHKTVNAWTPNTEEEINEMINLNVDNIITDDLELAKNVMRKVK